MKHIFSKTSLIILICISVSVSVFSQQLRSIEEIEKIVKREVENGRSASMVVGISQNGEHTIISYGSPIEGQFGQSADGETIYEIGSISKIFTTTILADMAIKGKLKLSDPVSMYLPDTISLREKNGKIITLGHLATHTSGLPVFQEDYVPADPQNPYKDYTIEDIYNYINTATVTENPGEGEYSNIGMALLANILCRIENSDYESLVNKIICVPLNMHNTTVNLSAKQKEQFATPYIVPGKKTKSWDFKAIEGAGAIKSCVNDMLNFLDAQLRPDEEELGRAINYSHIFRDSTSMKDNSIALGWFINHSYSDSIIWHNGSTGGFKSFTGFDKNNRTGVVILSNSTRNVNDIGFHILNRNFKIKEFQKKELISLSEKEFSRFKGFYLMEPGDTMHIYSSDNKFYLNAQNQGVFEIYPQKEDVFSFDQLPFNLGFKNLINGKYQTLILIDKRSNPEATRINRK